MQTNKRTRSTFSDYDTLETEPNDAFDLLAISNALDEIMYPKPKKNIPLELQMLSDKIPKTESVDPFEKYNGFDDNKKRYFMRCLESLIYSFNKSKNNCINSFSIKYKPTHMSVWNDETNPNWIYSQKEDIQFQKNQVYNYAMNVFYKMLVDKGYDVNKQEYNNNPNYIDIRL